MTLIVVLIFSSKYLNIDMSKLNSVSGGFFFMKNILCEKDCVYIS